MAIDADVQGAVRRPESTHAAYSFYGCMHFEAQHEWCAIVHVCECRHVITARMLLRVFSWDEYARACAPQKKTKLLGEKLFYLIRFPVRRLFVARDPSHNETKLIQIAIVL
jgi:hypothetical protein